MNNIINLYQRKTIFVTKSMRIQKKNNVGKRKTGVLKRMLIRDLVDLHFVLSNIKLNFSKYVKYIWNNSFLNCGCNDHRSKFSNLSNWKEEAWKKNQGFNGIRTSDLRVTGALLYQLSYEATHSYILHIISLITGDMNSINWPRSQCVAQRGYSISKRL